MTDASWSATAPGVAVERSAPQAVRVLRLRRPTPAAFDAFATALGRGLPNPGTVVAASGSRILWIGLHEWLVIGDVALDGPLRIAADAAAVSHVADITDAVVAYSVIGGEAATLLSKGCTIDVHPASFSTSQCVQTAFAQAAVTIERPADGTFVIYADRSFVRHLDLWFEDAVIEFRSKGKSS